MPVAGAVFVCLRAAAAVFSLIIAILVATGAGLCARGLRASFIRCANLDISLWADKDYGLQYFFFVMALTFSLGWAFNAAIRGVRGYDDRLWQTVAACIFCSLFSLMAVYQFVWGIQPYFVVKGWIAAGSLCIVTVLLIACDTILLGAAQPPQQIQI